MKISDIIIYIIYFNNYILIIQVILNYRLIKDDAYIIRCFEITQNPCIKSQIIVIEDANDKSLIKFLEYTKYRRSLVLNLQFKKISIKF